MKKDINILKLIVILIFLQRLPILHENFHEPIRYIIMVVLAIGISLVSFKNRKNKIRINRTLSSFLIVITWSTLLSLVALDLNLLLSLLLEYGIPFLIIIFVIFSNITKKDLISLSKLYIYLITIAAFSAVFYYIGGFKIEQIYLIPVKNELGLLMGIAVILSVLLIKNERTNFKFKLLPYLSLFLLIIMIFTNRNRNIIFGLTILLFVYMVKFFVTNINFKTYIYLITTIVGIVLILQLGAFDNIRNFIISSVVGLRGYSDLDSLSSGRLTGYKYAFDYISENPFFGFLFSKSIREYTPHNYLLNKAFMFGLIGFIPYLILYLNLIILTFKGLFNKDGFDKAPFILLLFSLIVSNLEYTFPFGPGTNQLMLWVFIGYSFKYIKQNNSVSNKTIEIYKEEV